MTEKVAKASLLPGDHGTTYGGNPLVCAAVDTVLQIFEEEHLLEHVKEVSVYLEEQLDQLVKESSAVKERRGKRTYAGACFGKTGHRSDSKRNGAWAYHNLCRR